MEEKEQKEIDFKNFIETCSEHELYFMIDESGAFLHRMNHLISHGGIDQEHVEGVYKDIAAVNKMQGQGAEQTKRFGVDFSLVEEYNEALKFNVKVPCPDYWKWLKHWNDWNESFNDETWDKFVTALDKKESVEEFLPKTKWNEV